MSRAQRREHKRAMKRAHGSEIISVPGRPDMRLAHDEVEAVRAGEKVILCITCGTIDKENGA